MANNYIYTVTFFNFSFRSLEDAKWNVKVSFTRSEALKYLTSQQEYISHYVGDKLHSKTPIYVDEAGNITFGKTFRV